MNNVLELKSYKFDKYKSKKKLSADYIGRGGAWLDTGSIEDFYKTSAFVSAIENRQGFKIACIEEIALNNKWIKLSATDRLTLGCCFFLGRLVFTAPLLYSGKNRRGKPVSNSTSIWRLCCLLHRGLANNWINARDNFSWWYRAAGNY